MSDQELWFDTCEHAGANPDWGTSIRLRLERFAARFPEVPLNDRRAVLLLHGASANHRTFTVNETIGLARRLLDKGLDPWLLDWRGSSLVAACSENADTLSCEPGLYTLSHAAAEDLPAAIRRMRSKYHVQGPISLLGHCMGSAVIAEAVALDHHDGLHVDRIVLLALGLFYEAPIDGRLKSEERVLERLIAANTALVTNIDPRLPSGDVATDTAGSIRPLWPAEIDDLYKAWPHALQFHGTDQVDTVEALCNRVAFMYGMPYHEPNLIEAIHTGEKPKQEAAEGDATPRPTPEEERRRVLEEQFGGIPLHLYLHCARNLRHGQATIARPTPSDRFVVSEEARSRFHSLDSVTLITGALNRLWHRDSIDRMYEWLTRGNTRYRLRVRKHVLEDYAHQDLLWGSNSPEDVYPKILAGVREEKPQRTKV